MATAAQKFAKEVEAARERAAKVAKDGLAGIQSQIGAKTRLVEDGYAAEVRAIYRGMTSTEQVKLLGELIEQNRGAEFAAIVKGAAHADRHAGDAARALRAAFIAKHAGPELGGPAGGKSAGPPAAGHWLGRTCTTRATTSARAAGARWRPA